jgi:hypothetical protein
VKMGYSAFEEERGYRKGSGLDAAMGYPVEEKLGSAKPGRRARSARIKSTHPARPFLHGPLATRYFSPFPIRLDSDVSYQMWHGDVLQERIDNA